MKIMNDEGDANSKFSPRPAVRFFFGVAVIEIPQIPQVRPDGGMTDSTKHAPPSKLTY